MIKTLTILIGVAVCSAGIAPARAEPQQRSFAVKLGERVEERRALVCAPQGAGPFAAVVFNHGSIVDGWGWPGANQRGYRLDKICEMFAAENYFVFAPIRENSPRGKGFMSYEDDYREIVLQAIAHVKTLPEVDRTRVALAGFSMGGLVSFKVALETPELQAVALLAPAFGRGMLAVAAKKIGTLNAPLLVMMEESDAQPIQQGVAALEEAGRAQGRPPRVVRYNRGGGHELFYDVGYWWDDLAAFLREHLAKH